MRYCLETCMGSQFPFVVFHIYKYYNKNYQLNYFKAKTPVLDSKKGTRGTSSMGNRS